MKLAKPLNIDFLKYTKLYFAISAIFIVPGLISLFSFGLKPAIDFTGGSLIEISVTPKTGQNFSQDDLRSSLTVAGIDSAAIQSTGHSYLIRTKTITNDQNQQFQEDLKTKVEATNELSFETVGPTLGKELLKKTLVAIVLASLVILGYVAYRFHDLTYGISAVLAMFHDTFLVIGIFSLLGHFKGIEVDTLFVTALLTILSFSVHDTIVVYDRIRETIHRHSKASLYDIINKSITETLSRSINNSMTIIFMLLALYLLGGQTTTWFVFALLIGTITGTYSSTFTAAPILMIGHNLQQKFNQYRLNRRRSLHR
jgi:preprotein translocase subunit SecF